MTPQPDDSLILHLPRQATNRPVATNVLIRMIRNAPGVQVRYPATPDRMGWVVVTKKAIIDRLRETGPNTLHACEWNGAVVVLGWPTREVRAVNLSLAIGRTFICCLSQRMKAPIVLDFTAVGLM